MKLLNVFPLLRPFFDEENALFYFIRIKIRHPAERAEFDKRLRCLFTVFQNGYPDFSLTMPALVFIHVGFPFILHIFMGYSRLKSSS
jgi:hypothetical protein